MKKMILAMLFAYFPISHACSSFVITGKTVWCGMNFDYRPDTRVKFRLAKIGERQVFHLTFLAENGQTVTTMELNDAGLFAAGQIVRPQLEPIPLADPHQLYEWQLRHHAACHFSTVAEIETYLESRQVLPGPETCHTLYADSGGASIVVEPGVNGHFITHPKNPWQVMTNFPNHQFVDVPYDSVRGGGAGRYRRAMKYLERHHNRFDLVHARELLNHVSLNTQRSKTLCSMIYSAQNSELYLALKGDFNRIWRFSFSDGRLVTLEGFQKTESFDLTRGEVDIEALIGVEEEIVE